MPSGETEAGSALAECVPLLHLSAGDGCGHTLLTPYSGTLSSKNYPGTYPNHTACRWRLHAPPGTSLLLAFGDVDLEPSERCAHSSLLLADPQADTTYGKGGSPPGKLRQRLLMGLGGGNITLHKVLDKEKVRKIQLFSCFLHGEGGCEDGGM